jgi:hypothetical protein
LVFQAICTFGTQLAWIARCLKNNGDARNGQRRFRDFRTQARKGGRHLRATRGDESVIQHAGLNVGRSASSNASAAGNDLAGVTDETRWNGAGAIRFPVTRSADTEGSAAAFFVLGPRLGNQAGFFIC